MKSGVMSTKRLIFLLLGFLLICPQSRAKNLYTELQKGVDYQKLKVSEYCNLHIFRLDPKLIKLDAILASDFGKTGLSVKEMTEQSHALLSINSNFFDAKGQALGLVIKNKKLLKSPRPISWWAAFLLNENHAQIRKVSANENFSGIEFATQAGPRLVINGQMPKLKKEFSPKSAIGLDAHGKIYIIASDTGIDIQDFAAWLVKSETKGGVGLTQALNLDGGSSTQLYTKVGKFSLNIPGFAKIPVGIGVFSKQP